MRVAVTGCLVLLYIVALQGDQADGHITFFSPKEMRELRVSVHFNSTFSSRAELFKKVILFLPSTSTGKGGEEGC